MMMRIVGVLAFALALGVLTVPAAQQAPPADPLAFVQHDYIHGIPYSEARRLGPTAEPALAALLENPGLAQWSPNIVVTLGYIGDVRALDPLTRFLEKTTGEVSVDRFRALILVPIAIGDLGRETSDARPKALEYLRAGARPTIWGDRRISWTFRTYKGQRLHEQLAQASVQGLGRLATEDAANFLRDLRGNPPFDGLRDTIDSSLQLLERLRREGAPRVFDSGPAPAATGGLPAGRGGGGRGPAFSGRGVVSQPLTIARHPSVMFADAQADARLGTATGILQKNDGGCPDEVACPVALMRSQSVGTFGKADDGLDIIDNDVEMHNVLEVKSAIVKIVLAIGWCNANGDARNPIVGCSKLGAPSSILIETAAGAAFAHEFGHTKGLGDLYHNECLRNIMNPWGTDVVAVNERQCNAYMRP
jgi:hypothetical protein